MQKSAREIELRGRLSGVQRMRLRALLDLMYTPGELAAAVGFTRRQVYRVYAHLGAPIERDGSGHLWINGKNFCAWYFKTYPKPALEHNFAFCMTCHAPTEIIEPELIEKGGIKFLQSRCRFCGRCVTRFIEGRKRKHD